MEDYRANHFGIFGFVALWFLAVMFYSLGWKWSLVLLGTGCILYLLRLLYRAMGGIRLLAWLSVATLLVASVVFYGWMPLLVVLCMVNFSLFLYAIQQIVDKTVEANLRRHEERLRRGY